MIPDTGNIIADVSVLHDLTLRSERRLLGFVGQIFAGVLALLSAAVIAFVIYRINVAWSDSPEKAVGIVGVILAVLLVIPPVAYFFMLRGEAKPAELGLTVIGSVCVLLAACYLFRISFDLMFPADFLIWSESDFVNDILKFRVAYPIFTAEVNNESFTYVPGSQIVTYFLAWLTGNATSLPAYRAVQVFFTLLSAFVAFLCCRRLLAIRNAGVEKANDSMWWGAIVLSGLFLIAGNSVTNPFTHLLHNDGLAQLVTIVAFWLLLEYEVRKDKRILVLMALLPAVGFWVKQSLIIWAVLYSGYLLIFDTPRSFKRQVLFAVSAFGCVLISISIGYALWREDFVYWAFTVLGAHGVSPLRSFKHLLDIWPYYTIGLIGGMALFQENGAFRKWFGLWLLWLTLITVETYTSGVAWMLNHIGPGCLIAGIWFFAALPSAWSRIVNARSEVTTFERWLRVAVTVAIVCLLFNGLGIVRVPIPRFGSDTARYVGEIEREFVGQRPEDVLLDFGSWMYLPSGVVMKDRAPSIGERGYSQTGDFSGILERLEQRRYKKIMVRNLHEPDFWYDYQSWDRSSNIRKTLLENYQEIGRIKKPEGISENEIQYGFREISILVPRQN